MIFSAENPPLFAWADAEAVVSDALHSIERWIDAIPASDFKKSDAEIVSDVVTHFSVPPLTVAHDTLAIVERREVAVLPDGGWTPIGDSFRPRASVRGIRARFSVSYLGREALLHYKPSPEWKTQVFGTVIQESENQGRIEIVMNVAGPHPEEALREQIRESVTRLQATAEAQRPVIERWNDGIAKLAAPAIAARREFLGIVENLPEFLDVPLIANKGRAPYHPVALRAQAVEPTPVRAEEGAVYHIAPEGYELILHVLRHFGRSFEETPAIFAKLPEERIRDFFLGALNIYFDKAHGERFRRHGKTDIAIDVKEHAAFLAECKLWKGPRSMQDAFDQLLTRYALWRDCSCAILLFNQSVAGFTRIVDRLPEQIRALKYNVMDLVETFPGEWRVKMVRPHDRSSILTITVFVFDYRAKKRAK